MGSYFVLVIKNWSIVCLILISSFVKAQDVESLKDSLKIDGDISMRNVLYSMQGIDNRRVPYSFVLGANITLTKGEFSVPLGITWSEQERSFSQPFNQFGIAPSYKWVKTYLGYNSMNWNNYTLAGAQFLGAGVELNPKKIRFGFMYGRFRRATPIDSIGFIQSNSNGFPSYERNGWATRIGIGSDTRNIDLIIFRGNDKEHNTSPVFKDSITPVFPAENTAIGLKTTGTIGKWATYFVDGGVSLFNRDKTAPLADSSLEESGGLANTLSGIHPLRLSTSAYFGADAGLNMTIKGHSIGLNTKYVLPDYQAMGIYYMDNDVFSYGFTHAFSAWQSKINVNYGLNRLNDNLLDKKPVTTIRVQPVVSLSFNPSSLWGIETNWNNFYTRQEDGTIQLSDSFRMEQSNPGLTITPHAQWGDTVTYHTVFLLYSSMQLIDRNPVTAEFSQYTATVYGANYSYSLLPLNWAFSSGFNYTINENSLLKEKAYGLNLGASRADEKSKWNAGANLALQFSNLSTNTSLGLNGTYLLKHKQTLTFGMTFLNHQAKDANANDFNELTFTLTYNKNFNYVHKQKK